MSEWYLVKIKLTYSKRYYELFKNSVFIEIYRSGHTGWVIVNFQRQFIFMYLQINDTENGERCIWNATCKRKFRINLVKKTRISSLWGTEQPHFRWRFDFRACARENKHFFFPFQAIIFFCNLICLNVYSEFCKYRPDLCRNKHVLTKCHSCLPAMQYFIYNIVQAFTLYQK